MAVISNLVRDTTLLPAITNGQLDVINEFRPLSIKLITKPHSNLWEISGRLDWRSHCQDIVLFLSEDGRMIGNVSVEPTKEHRNHTVSRRFHGWTDWPYDHKEPEIQTSNHGFFNLSPEHGLLPELRKWCIDEVVNRQYPRLADYYGRIWPEGIKRCPVCGQPEDDDDFAIDHCDHERFSDKLVQAYKDDFATRSNTKESA